MQIQTVPIHRQSRRHLALLGVTTLLLSSCQIFGLHEHVETMEAFGVVTIQVSPVPSGTAPTYALAWTSDKGGELESAGFHQLPSGGIAAFTLRTDRVYTVGAFTDTNGNGSYDAGEPGDYVKGVKPRSLGDPDVQSKISKLTLHTNHGLPPGKTIAIPKENKELGRQLNLSLGEVVTLDEQRFATDAGGSGLWRPMDFLHEHRPGIYFTEPYDPARVPVLLVYGIGGTPQDFRYFANHFDRKRYQVWFYHYPSGMRLERVARAMSTGLNLLRARYGFKQCDVVAHSMGGLVARVGIDEAVRSAGVDFIPRFASIATPWGGHAAASSGIRRLKKPVPSWLDVAPESAFLTELYETPLPKGTKYLLIYGSQKGGPFWIKGENDGVVTVASETDSRVKKDAASVIHLSYGHVEILQRDQTVAETLKFLGSG